MDMHTNTVTCYAICYLFTSPDGAVGMSSTNGLVGNGFTSQYRLQSRAEF